MISLKSIYDAFMVQGFKEVLLPFAMTELQASKPSKLANRLEPLTRRFATQAR
jgi:hypothetical protein